jgi:hypothetical protein
MKRRQEGIEVLHRIRADAQKEAAMISSSRVAWRESRKGADPALAVLIALIVAAWLLAVVLGGAAGLFESGPARPPLPILAALAVPLGIFSLAYALSPRFRDFVLSLDLRMLTAAQSWRVIGGMFMFLWAFDLRPALFAFPAGLGDVAVGIAAVFVLRAMIDEAPGWPRKVLLLNLAGLLDFVGAFATGILTSNSSLGLFAGDKAEQWASMGSMPLSLIPTFAMPLWIILHRFRCCSCANWGAGSASRKDAAAPHRSTIPSAERRV